MRHLMVTAFALLLCARCLRCAPIGLTRTTHAVCSSALTLQSTTHKTSSTPISPNKTSHSLFCGAQTEFSFDRPALITSVELTGLSSKQQWNDTVQLLVNLKISQRIVQKEILVNNGVFRIRIPIEISSSVEHALVRRLQVSLFSDVKFCYSIFVKGCYVYSYPHSRDVKKREDYVLGGSARGRRQMSSVGSQRDRKAINLVHGNGKREPQKSYSWLQLAVVGACGVTTLAVVPPALILTLFVCCGKKGKHHRIIKSPSKTKGARDSDEMEGSSDVKEGIHPLGSPTISTFFHQSNEGPLLTSLTPTTTSATKEDHAPTCAKPCSTDSDIGSGVASPASLPEDRISSTRECEGIDSEPLPLASTPIASPTHLHQSTSTPSTPRTPILSPSSQPSSDSRPSPVVVRMKPTTEAELTSLQGLSPLHRTFTIKATTEDRDNNSSPSNTPTASSVHLHQPSPITLTPTLTPSHHCSSLHHPSPQRKSEYPIPILSPIPIPVLSPVIPVMTSQTHPTKQACVNGASPTVFGHSAEFHLQFGGEVSLESSLGELSLTSAFSMMGSSPSATVESCAIMSGYESSMPALNVQPRTPLQGDVIPDLELDMPRPSLDKQLAEDGTKGESTLDKGMRSPRVPIRVQQATMPASTQLTTTPIGAHQPTTPIKSQSPGTIFPLPTTTPVSVQSPNVFTSAVPTSAQPLVTTIPALSTTTPHLPSFSPPPNVPFHSRPLPPPLILQLREKAGESSLDRGGKVRDSTMSLVVQTPPHSGRDPYPYRVLKTFPAHKLNGDTMALATLDGDDFTSSSPWRSPDPSRGGVATAAAGVRRCSLCSHVIDKTALNDDGEPLYLVLISRDEEMEESSSLSNGTDTLDSKHESTGSYKIKGGTAICPTCANSIAAPSESPVSSPRQQLAAASTGNDEEVCDDMPPPIPSREKITGSGEPVYESISSLKRRLPPSSLLLEGSAESPNSDEGTYIITSMQKKRLQLLKGASSSDYESIPSNSPFYTRADDVQRIFQEHLQSQADDGECLPSLPCRNPPIARNAAESQHNYESLPSSLPEKDYARIGPPPDASVEDQDAASPPFIPEGAKRTKMLKIDSQGYASIVAKDSDDQSATASGVNADVTVVNADQAWEYQQQRGYAPLTLACKPATLPNVMGPRSSAGSQQSPRADLQPPAGGAFNRTVPCDYEVPIPRRSPVTKLVKQKVVYSESEQVQVLDTRSTVQETDSPPACILSPEYADDVFELNLDGSLDAEEASAEPKSGEAESQISDGLSDKSVSSVSSRAIPTSTNSQTSMSSHSTHSNISSSQSSDTSSREDQEWHTSPNMDTQIELSKARESDDCEERHTDSQSTVEGASERCIDASENDKKYDVERTRANTFGGVQQRQNLGRRDRRTVSEVLLHISLNQQSGIII